MGDLTLKAFWTEVDARLAACSADELRAILRAMAQEVPPGGREAFLNRLHLPAAPAEAAPPEERKALQAEIDALIRKMKTAMDRWAESDRWYEYDDEETLGPYEEFVAPLGELFKRADALFDAGDTASARKVYEKLFFQGLEIRDEYDRGVYAFDLYNVVNLRESRARYLRAVYETNPLAQRAPALFAALRQMKVTLERSVLGVKDLIEITPRPLPDEAQFGELWIAFLRQQSGRDADSWLREAVRLWQGVEGLAALARAEGVARPRAYLDWCALLEQERRFPELLAAAEEALQALPPELPIRAMIADRLCTAAAELHETARWRRGRWEAFAARPDEARLLDLWESGPTGEVRTASMQQALGYLDAYRLRVSELARAFPPEVDPWELPSFPGSSLPVHVGLLAGEWDEVQKRVAGEEVLGWHSRSSGFGLAISFFLVLGAGYPARALPPNLKGLWADALEAGRGYSPAAVDPQPDLRERFDRAYREILANATVDSDRVERWLAWCLEVTRQRVEAIVGGQKRKSYGAAALLTVACAEVLSRRGARSAGDAFITEIRERYPRHTAFKQELQMAVKRK